MLHCVMASCVLIGRRLALAHVASYLIVHAVLDIGSR